MVGPQQIHGPSPQPGFNNPGMGYMPQQVQGPMPMQVAGPQGFFPMQTSGTTFDMSSMMNMIMMIMMLGIMMSMLRPMMGGMSAR
jgi:hypothetical protein